MKILLVEDNEMNRDMLSRRLARNGFEIAIAVDGQEGVDKAISEKPNLILMDMSLPVIDGWEATRKIKADPATRIIPVIALTADVMSHQRQAYRMAGMDGVVAKPFTPAQLLGEIAKIAERANDDFEAVG